ncbi:MAG: hypothetical protein JWM76_3898 [Pseudonocardiales bacterium]|nr:hypothetical protein [Pseudonocardiales bacterium]
MIEHEPSQKWQAPATPMAPGAEPAAPPTPRWKLVTRWRNHRAASFQQWRERWH